MTIAKSLVARLADKVAVGDGCWEWRASLNDGGYGQITVNHRPLRAHRVMYELLVGPIPDGLTLDHLCRNRACVRPDHLEPVTRGENVRRGVGGEMARLRAAAKTHCKRGHPYTEANTRLSKLENGYTARTCRACHALRARERRSCP